jgi:hypothetical protein
VNNILIKKITLKGKINKKIFLVAKPTEIKIKISTMKTKEYYKNLFHFKIILIIYIMLEKTISSKRANI